MVLLWIILYGAAYTLATRLPREASPWLVSLVMLGYVGALLLWIFRTGKAHHLGLCVPRHINWIPYLPLLMLPVYNLFTSNDFPPELSRLLLMLAVCAAEELFFRGFLLRFLRKYGTLAAIILSSSVFALFHFCNLPGGGNLSVILPQVVCAFAAGVCYGSALEASKSLLPAFMAHFLTNITAGPTASAPTPLLWLCIAAYGCYGIMFYIQEIFNKKERQL